MKKVIRKILFLLIFIIFILGLNNFSLATSGATEELKYLGVCLDDLEENEIAALKYIVKQIKIHEEEIDIDEFQVNSERIPKLMELVSNVNDVFGIVDFGVSSYGDIITRVSPTYTLTEEEFVEYWEKIDKKVDKFLKEVNQYDNLTELDKIIFASNFVGKYCQYRGSQSNGVWHNIAGALGDGIGVCDGYAKALSYLLAKLDIESEVIESPAMQPRHAWLLVKYENDWYHIDMTANDSGGYGSYHYATFMAPDEIFDGTHGVYGVYGWVTNHKASNSQFLSDSIWDDAGLHPLVYNGESWCIIDNYYKDSVDIYKIDKETYEKEIILNIPVDDEVWGEICLATDGKRYYFTTKSAVYSVNYDGSDLKKIFNKNEEDKRIYGIDFIDGVIYCSVEIPTTTGLVSTRTEKILVETDIPEYTTLDVDAIESIDTITFNAKENLKDIINSKNFPVLDHYYTVEVFDKDENSKKINTELMGGKNKIQIKNPLGEVKKEYIAIVKGDITGNGLSRMYDAFQILKDTIMSGATLDAIDIKIRDYNGDGNVRMYDAFQFLKEAILGK